jgi:glycosyltransferase involved in cell wall biosynthesis
MTRELGLSSHVLFWGDVLQVKMPAHYAMADVIVNLSMYEPFGLIPVEAMACGKPIVVYDSGGPSETVEDGVTGVKVKPRDIGALSRSISTILQDGSLAKQMGERGRARVLANYTWNLTAKRLLESIRLASQRCHGSDAL